MEKTITLEPLNRTNWEAACNLKLPEEQRRFIPDNVHAVAQSKFEPCDPYAVVRRQNETAEIVGFLMICRWSGLYWVTRIMIDEQYQGENYGGRALEEAIKQIRLRPDAFEIRATIDARNALAEHLFTSKGFRRIGQPDDKEIVMSLELK